MIVEEGLPMCNMYRFCGRKRIRKIDAIVRRCCPNTETHGIHYQFGVEFILLHSYARYIIKTGASIFADTNLRVGYDYEGMNEESNEMYQMLQMELQNIDKHTGINTWVCRDACRLMKSIVASNWNNCHVCNAVAECTYCESSVIWHQLCLQLVTYMAPENPAYPPDVSPLR